MVFDQTAKKIAELLAVCLTYNAELDKRIIAIITLLGLYGGNKQQDKSVIESIQSITNARSNSVKDLSESIVNYVVSGNKWFPEDKKGYFTLRMSEALRTRKQINDTSMAVVVTKQIANSDKLLNRQAVFAQSNGQVLDVSENGNYYRKWTKKERDEVYSGKAFETLDQEKRKGLVIWRSRTQADGACREYDGKVMTTGEFKSLYPIHPNCMCTAELIPITMSDEEVAKRRFKDTRQESERVPNTISRQYEKMDKEQYERWKKEGVDLPSFADWRKLKQNKNKQEEFQQLQNEYKQKRWYNNTISYADLSAELKEKVNINPQKNNRHIKGTYEYKEYAKKYSKANNGIKPSVLEITNEQAQELIKSLRFPKSFKGQGTTIHISDEITGIFIDQKTGETIKTNTELITFSKNGSHFTPREPRKEIKRIWNIKKLENTYEIT